MSIVLTNTPYLYIPSPDELAKITQWFNSNSSYGQPQYFSVYIGADTGHINVWATTNQLVSFGLGQGALSGLSKTPAGTAGSQFNGDFTALTTVQKAFFANPPVSQVAQPIAQVFPVQTAALPPAPTPTATSVNVGPIIGSTVLTNGQYGTLSDGRVVMAPPGKTWTADYIIMYATQVDPATYGKYVGYPAVPISQALIPPPVPTPPPLPPLVLPTTTVAPVTTVQPVLIAPPTVAPAPATASIAPPTPVVSSVPTTLAPTVPESVTTTLTALQKQITDLSTVVFPPTSSFSASILISSSILPTVPGQEPTISKLFLFPPSASITPPSGTQPTPPTASVPPPPPPPPEIVIGLDLGDLATDFSGSLEPSASAAADAATALTVMQSSASVSVTGDNGVMPMIPKFDIAALLGEGASALTIAAAMKLASAITNYVTAYVDSQVSPLQMQVSSLASAAKQAPQTTLSIVPGKLKALKATANSLQAKTEAFNNARNAAQAGLVNAQQIAVSRAADAQTAVQHAATDAANQAAAATTKAQETAADTTAAARTTVSSATGQTTAPLTIQQNQKQQVIQQGVDEFWDTTSFTSSGGGTTFTYIGKPIGIAQTEQWDVHPEFVDVGKDSVVRTDLNQKYIDAGGGAWPEYKTAIENRLNPLLASYHSQVLRQQAVTAGTLS